MRRHLAASYALLIYLSSGMGSAMLVMDNHLLAIEDEGLSGSSEQEEFFVFYAKLLHRDMVMRMDKSRRSKQTNIQAGYKPSILRDVLERAIAKFPNNSLFLSLFLHNECKHAILCILLVAKAQDDCLLHAKRG
jgi:hypothetical protein